MKQKDKGHFSALPTVENENAPLSNQKIREEMLR